MLTAMRSTGGLFLYRDIQGPRRILQETTTNAGTCRYNEEGTLGSFRFYFKMPPSLFGISQSIKQQQKRRWGRVGEKRGGFVCGVSELCRFFLPNEVMATMSRQYSPQSPAWSQDVPRITIRPLPVLGFAPRIRINGRDVTEKRTHGHDTWFAFWNLNNNLMKPQELFDAYSHAVYWRIVLIQGYTGAEKNFARDNDKCRHMQVQWRGDVRIL